MLPWYTAFFLCCWVVELFLGCVQLGWGLCLENEQWWIYFQIYHWWETWSGNGWLWKEKYAWLSGLCCSSGLSSVKHAWTCCQGISFYVFFAQYAHTNGNIVWNFLLTNPDMIFNNPLSFTGVLFLKMTSAVSRSKVFVICGKIRLT